MSAARAAVLIGLLLALPAHATLVQVVDDSGRRLAFSRPPQRIVSLTPHLTELLYAVGAGPQLVGVDAASDYPAAARSVPRIGDYSRVNLEQVVALRPDLVVVWVGGNRPIDIHALKMLKLPVLQTRATHLTDIARLLRLLGRASGHAAAGEAAARDVEIHLAAVRRPAVSPPVPVFYQVWDHPLMTVGGEHWISDAIAWCGGRNVFADLPALSPTVSREAVLARAPAVIVSGSDAPRAVQSWETYGNLPAVKNAAFVRVDADRLHRVSPRLVEGVDTLCAALRPYMR